MSKSQERRTAIQTAGDMKYKINKTGVSFEIIACGTKNVDGEYPRIGGIHGVVDWNGNVTLTDHMGRAQFLFSKSEPERVLRVAEMMTEAAKLAQEFKGFIEDGKIIK